MSNELSIAELDGEVCTELPQRPLMSHRRLFRFKRFHRTRFVSCGCSCGGFNGGFGGRGFNEFGGRGFDGGFGGFGGSVSNANFTNQSIFNPQTAVGFGRGDITQIGGNSNFNSSTQFGVVTGF